MMPGDTCDWPECTAPAETQEGPMALCRIHLIYFSADPDDWEELVQAERERSPAPTTDPSDN